jgi:type I restriction enzyme S subunit
VTGWERAILGELCTIQSGSSNTQDADPNGEFVFFDRSRTPKKSNRYLLECEAVIIAGEGAEFRPKKYTGKFDLHQRAYAIYGFGDRLIGDYLYYYLEHVHTYFQEVAVGSTVKSLRQRHFHDLPVNFPASMAEQQRIVGILDQAFEKIAKAKANAERNLANAKEFLTNGFDELISVRCQDAPLASLDVIADFKNGLNFTRSSKGEVIKIVGVADFKSNFWTPYDLDEVQIEGSLSEAYELRDGDILVVRSNGNKELIGRCILARGTEGKTSHSGFTIRVRPVSEGIDPEYLTHFMKSSAVRRSLVASGDGANISSLNQKALSSIVVPIPPVSVQREIVNDLSALGEKIIQLTASMTHKSSMVGELQRSMLHQAFSGKL